MKRKQKDTHILKIIFLVHIQMIYIQYTNDILLIHNKNTKNSKNG